MPLHSVLYRYRPQRTLRSPPSAIRRASLISETLTLGCTCGNEAFAIACAVRRAIVKAVSDGLAEPRAGNTAVPLQNNY